MSRKCGNVVTFSKSWVLTWVISLFRILIIFTPSVSHAYTITDSIGFGKNGIIIAVEYLNLKEVTRNKVSVIPNKRIRLTISTVGNIRTMLGGAVSVGRGWDI